MLLQNELAPCAPRVNALALRREGPVDGCQGGEGVGVWGCERMGELDGGGCERLSLCERRLSVTYAVEGNIGRE